MHYAVCDCVHHVNVQSALCIMQCAVCGVRCAVCSAGLTELYGLAWGEIFTRRAGQSGRIFNTLGRCTLYNVVVR